MNSAALAQLRDIHTVPPPGLWPLAPGWWLVGLLAGAMGLWLGRRLYRAYCRRRRQRLILRELARLRESFGRDSNSARFAAGLSMLLRRVALACFPRAHRQGETVPAGERALSLATGGDLVALRAAGRSRLCIRAGRRSSLIPFFK